MGNETLVDRIGHITRMLHDSLRELGLDKEVEKVANAIPDTRDRLDYVVTVSERAAERALNAVDRVQPIQDELDTRTQELNARWQSWLESQDASERTRQLALDTQAHLDSVARSVQATRDELLEIVMAQDFQDLTGQVIKKMTVVICGIEQQLLQVLLDSSSEGMKPGATDMRSRAAETASPMASLINGPSVKANDVDTLSSQDQVDDLLDELGF
ncbi:protein phosphatase CheZ [Pistricoccus aurantiacus]|uniref:protein phosphatase CheZ n=1 Tax=Pistricoccus aurantiacus TaxID=1883414 RepID=UPI00362D607E